MPDFVTAPMLSSRLPNAGHLSASASKIPPMPILLQFGARSLLRFELSILNIDYGAWLTCDGIIIPVDAPGLGNAAVYK